MPLMERIKFLAIYSSNLDEFFRVRVSGHRNLVRVGKKTKRRLDYEPETVLKSIHKIVNKQQEEFNDIFDHQIIPELELHNINLLAHHDLNDDQIEFIENYFQDNLLPFVQPVILIRKRVRPFLNNAALYLALHLRVKGLENGKNEYAIVKIPSDHLPRFIELPSRKNQHDLIMLDDIVRYSARWLFPGYEILDAFSLKLTRDADLYIEDEFSGDLIEKIKKNLKKRSVGPTSRFVHDRQMPDHLLDFLSETFELEEYDLLPEGPRHNNFDFFSFPSFGKHFLKNAPMPPLPYNPLEKARNIFEAMRRRDHLLHVPYHSYESVIRLFETASKDPRVTHIKIVQYRVAKKSRIMDALIKAVQSGKQVSAFIEVKARFDEEANLKWGEKLEAAGATVHYSFPGLKVHSKLALITRKERGKNKYYSYLSTGNFHEDTAKIYSDLGLFTTDERLTREVSRVFAFLETVKVPRQKFRHLLVGQFNLRESLEKLIDQEIENAQAGKEAKIILKMNSLQDQKMVIKLYEASQAGVKIQLIIRGLCSLVPKVKGVSDNIEAISIVDRYLEHARIFIFHNDGNEQIYLSSADWMTRNLSYRIETIFPIYDESIKQEIKEIMEFQLKDNVKARVIDRKQSNKYVIGDPDTTIRAQRDTYFYFKMKSESKVKV